ncbi:MAG: chorismate-pyruvate lyase [Flavobacteriales bacterium]|jgi:chorismate-pyruvate lyase
MNKLFESSGFLPFGSLSLNDGRSLDFLALPPILRVLLTTDGTVTKTLESYFWEPVQVQCISQSRQIASEAIESIEVECGDSYLQRRVSLVGEHSGNCYATADSRINTALLPVDITEALEANTLGIGELLRESGLETYRELLAIGFSHDDDDTRYRIERSYRIVMGSHPCIEIIEFFPVALYKALSAV